jgi:hypothetical protein
MNSRSDFERTLLAQAGRNVPRTALWSRLRPRAMSRAARPRVETGHTAALCGRVHDRFGRQLARARLEVLRWTVLISVGRAFELA